jgi:hypothetical protein
VSEVSTQFLSVDCFLDKRTSNLKAGVFSSLFDPNANTVFRIFFQKLIILGFAPLMVVAGSYTVWSVYFLCHGWRNKEENILKILMDAENSKSENAARKSEGKPLSSSASLLERRNSASMKQ